MTDVPEVEPVPTLQEQRELVPGYESDERAVGDNRKVDPLLIDDTDWADLHLPTAQELGYR